MLNLIALKTCYTNDHSVQNEVLYSVHMGDFPLYYTRTDFAISRYVFAAYFNKCHAL